MQYQNIKKGQFLTRPNRFIAHILLDGKEEICHVKNTGRCRELLIPDTEVYVTACPNPARKTKYDLVCVRKGDALINIDSMAPNAAFGEWVVNSHFFGDISILKPEYTYGNSRFDFYIEAGSRKIFVEIKGVTLESDGVVRFPDAPTERGSKHLKELIKCKNEGFDAHVFFIAQMENTSYFTPNRETDPVFAATLSEAAKSGVGVHCLSCHVTPGTMTIQSFVPVKL